MKKWMCICISFLCYSITEAQVCFKPVTLWNVSPSAPTIASGDFNSDGFDDLVTSSWHSDSISVLLGSSAGNFSIRSYLVGGGPFCVTVNDFNKDGKLDLAVGTEVVYPNPNFLAVLFGDGAGGFSAPARTYITEEGPVHIASGDFNGDGAPDVATANNVWGMAITVFLNNGSGIFTPTTYTPMINPYYIVTGDLNHDGFDDIVVSNFNGTTIAVFMANGFGQMSAPVIYPTASKPFGLGIYDFTGDSNLDIVVACEGSSEVTLFSGDGTGGLSYYNSFYARGSPSDIALADYNNDGMMDIGVTDYWGSKAYVMQNNGAGSFDFSPDFSLIKKPYGMCKGDFNGDGLIDLAAANIDEGVASVLIRNPFIVSAVATPSVICFGNPVVLNGTGANQYNWSDGIIDGQVFYPATTTTYTVIGKNKLGCVNSNTISVQVSCVGIEENYQNVAYTSIFPNPANGKFTIETTFEADVRVYNSLGEFIIGISLIPGKNLLDLCTKPKGIYLLEIKKDRRSEFKKVVLE